MKRLIAFAAAASLSIICAVSMSATPQEEGVASEERELPLFSSIKVSGPFDVYYVQSDLPKVVIEGNEEYFGKVITEVKKDVLTVGMEKGKYRDLVLKVTIYSAVADHITSSISGNFFDIAGHTSADDIEYKMSGSGDVQIENVSSSDDIEIVSTGSGNVRAEKIQCEELDASLSGSGNINVKDVQAKDLDVRQAGCGDVVVEQADIRKEAELTLTSSGAISLDANVGGEIEVKLNGSGNITLNGKCNKLEVNISGSGDVNGKLNYNRISTNCKGSGKVKL